MEELMLPAVVLEKTLESPLDSKEIKPVIPKEKCEVKVKVAQSV